MLIELHTLTSHAPANLNRDDLGRPKTAVFGGTQRARISSQAIKRSIRTSNYLADNLGGRLSTRSRQIPKLVYDRLAAENAGDEGALTRLKLACTAFINVLGKVDAKHELQTSQIVFLTPDEIDRATKYIRELALQDEKALGKLPKDKEFGARAASEIGLNRTPSDAVDMALFGRMTTDDANSFASVDASMQVAHALSTHTVAPEVDWFTAVDDFTTGEEDRGSGHLGEVEFNSAVYYKYFSCNLPLLVRNMNGARDQAIEALVAVLDASCRVTPSGKQNTFASHAMADTALLVVRRQRTPVSLANAFEQAVSANGDGLLAESRERLIRHYCDLVRGYSLSDQALAFTVDGAARVQFQQSLPAEARVVLTLDELFTGLKGILGATA